MAASDLFHAHTINQVLYIPLSRVKDMFEKGDSSK